MSSHVINNSGNNKPTQQQRFKPLVSKSTKFNKSPRSAASTAATTANINSTNNSTATITVRSKFTERKAALAPQRTRSLRLDVNPTNNAANAKLLQPQAHVKIERKVIIQSVVPKPKQWNRKDVKPKASSLRVTEKAEPTIGMEIGIQTNEMEILNHDLLIGDIKFMLPTKSLVTEIDRDRQEAKKKAMLKAQRKFEEHAEKQEEHLTDLKEFLEKAVVSKRARKPRDTLEIDKKLISSMDEILSREVRRTESITDIKGRIKRKEKELMSLFETVENIQILGNKN